MIYSVIMDMKRKYNIFKLLALLALLGTMSVSCGELIAPSVSETLQIDTIVFSQDYEELELYVSVKDGFNGFLNVDSLGDNVTVKESIQSSLPHVNTVKPLKVKGVKNITAEHFEKIGMSSLVLVDLTLPQKFIDEERDVVRQIYTFLNRDNLYIAFLKSGGVITETELLTDYILDSRFYKDSGAGDKCLYRGIHSKLLELNAGTGPMGKCPRHAMFVLSDGEVWGEREPYDPEHFDIEHRLVEYAGEAKSDACFFYINMRQENADSSNKTLIAFCDRIGGLYQDKFIWAECRNHFEREVGLSEREFLILMDNHAGLEMDGVSRRIEVTIESDGEDSPLYGSTSYTVGNKFFPVIVHGVSSKIIAIRGGFLLLDILLLLYLILQFIVPRARYNLFRKKYVSGYVGPNMCLNGMNVAESCYLCKAPFKKGDTIVAKCSHTMHLGCWEENNYHCPDYGSRCKSGSFYYNSSNIFDWNNAPFFAKWLYMSVIAAIVSWLVFYLFMEDLVPSLNGSLVTNVFNSSPNSYAYGSELNVYNSYMSYLPSLSFILAVSLSFMLSLQIDSKRARREKIAYVAGRTLAAGLLAFILFMLNDAFTIAVENPVLEQSVELVSWLALAYGMSVILTYRTPMAKPDKRFYAFFLAAALIAFGWAYVLYLFAEDYRILISLVFLGFCASIALALAKSAPKSNNYVLHTEGCMKSTDIALYKWFRSNPAAAVTIGKSVDCDIQLSWDIRNDVAPVNARIFMRDSKLYLCALERGVFIDGKRELKPDEVVRIYQRTMFSIGSTTFTYTERDLH